MISPGEADRVKSGTGWQSTSPKLASTMPTFTPSPALGPAAFCPLRPAVCQLAAADLPTPSEHLVPVP
jgi:hypothetical protein